MARNLPYQSDVDANYYYAMYADVAAAGVPAARHYHVNGWHEGRNPNEYFDTLGYLTTYQDVAAAGIDPLAHFHNFGFREGRTPSPAFDGEAYLAANPDVAAYGYDPLAHYLRFGRAEGRAVIAKPLYDADGTGNAVAQHAAAGTGVGVTFSWGGFVSPNLHYVLVGDTSGGGFAVDTDTGRIIVADGSKIDYDGAGPSHSYTVTVQASDLGHTINQSAVITVGHVNHAPAGTDGRVTTLEDTAYTFKAADFGFTDPNDAPADTLRAVTITTLPASTAGVLTLNGAAVTAGQSIAAADIPNLKFTPALNANGTAEATFTFQVQDSGGTANGGQDTDQSPNTIKVDVTAVNDAPSSGNASVTTLENNAYTFKPSDFPFADPADGGSPNALAAVKIDTLPAAGTLRFNGTAIGQAQVVAGYQVSAADLAAGKLTFLPAQDANGAGYATFTFQVRDTGGTANGGVDLDPTAHTMTINVTPVNDAPVVTAGPTSTFQENGQAVDVAPAATITDVDSGTLAGAVLKLTNAQVGDTLSVRGATGATGTLASGIAYSVDNDAHTVTFGHTDSLADYQAALRLVQYASTSENPGNTARTFSIQVDDGGAANHIGTTGTSVAVVPVNDAPVNQVPPSQSVDEDGALVFSSANGNRILISDVDAGSGFVSVTLTAPHGFLKLNGQRDGANQISFGGTLDGINSLLDGMTYYPSSNYYGPDTITITTNDRGNSGTGPAQSATSTIDITVNPVNDPPTASVPSGAYDATEGVALNLKGTGLSVADVDGGAGREVATLLVGEGKLLVTAGNSGVQVVGSGSSSVKIFGTIDQINALLGTGGTGTVTYTETRDTPSANVPLALSITDNGATGSGGAQKAHASGSIVAAPVDDAPTFKVGDGKVTTPFSNGGSIIKVQVQADDKIVVAGYAGAELAVARYNADGSLDTGFGSGGKVTTPFDAGGRGNSMQVQADGKIVVSGYADNGSNEDFLLVRYNADGSLDSRFGSGGKVTTAVSSSNDYGYEVQVQADGKIVVAGGAGPDSTSNFAVVRYNADGTLDMSFGTNGKVTTPVSTGRDAAATVEVQVDGKIVAAGVSSNKFAVVRYNADGTLDTGFGTDGKVTTPVNSSVFGGQTVQIQADDKIVVSGAAVGTSGTGYDFALIRYNADGSLDTSFGTDGKVTTDLGSVRDVGFGLVVQPDGKLVVSGTRDYGTANAEFAVVRYNPDGTLDTSFGVNGKVTTPIGSTTDTGFSLQLQSDGKLVVVGSSQGDFAVVRYDVNGTLDPTFDAVNTLDGRPIYSKGSAPVVLDADVKIYDAELHAAGSYAGAVLTLARDGGANSTDHFGANGTLSLQNGKVTIDGAQVGTFTQNAGTLKITFSGGNASEANVDYVLQHITYENTSAAPPASVQIDWTFSDGNAGAQGSGDPQTVKGHTVVSIQSGGAPMTTLAVSHLLATKPDATDSHDAGGDTAEVTAAGPSIVAADTADATKLHLDPLAQGDSVTITKLPGNASLTDADGVALHKGQTLDAAQFAGLGLKPIGAGDTHDAFSFTFAHDGSEASVSVIVQHGSALTGTDAGERIIGGPGVETLHGGGGADHFVFDVKALAAAQGVAPVVAHVTDYSSAANDTIDLSALFGREADPSAHVSDLVHATATVDGAALQVNVAGSGAPPHWVEIAHLDGVASDGTVDVALDAAHPTQVSHIHVEAMHV